MRNFLKICEGIDPMPILQGLAHYDDLWGENKLRTNHPETAHAEVSDVWVWFNDVDPQAMELAIDDRDVIPYRAWTLLPQLRPVVFAIMRAAEGVRLGRVLITRLGPGKRIYQHVDGGAPAEYYSRYHLALQSLPGANFQAGDEVINMRSGELWRFNNRVEHSVVNNSADDRIVLIVDVRRG